MKTKIVYVVTSSDKDIYLEQCWASAHSVKIYNPTCKIVVVTDRDTESNILNSERKNILSVVDEIKGVDIPDEYNQMEKSRWLKTSLRELVDGDMIYVDGDTIITGDLSDIDNFDFSVGGVLDSNVERKDHHLREMLENWVRWLYGIDLKPTTNYINGGVLYMKDDENAHNFMSTWHKEWKYCRSKGSSTDQQSLIKITNETDILKIMPGEYNAQVVFSVRYLNKAKIVHYYNCHNWLVRANPLFQKETFLQIKKERGISKEMDERIRNVKNSFVTQSTIVGNDDFKVVSSPVFALIRNIYTRYPKVFKRLEKISNFSAKKFA